MKKLNFKSFDDTVISYCVWNEVEKPKAIVQIVHGMAEYIARYDHFAKYLNSLGYIVLGDDHRGHGDTAGEDNLGITDSNCFENTLKDLAMLSDIARDKYKLPLFIFGHSYGSFLSQAYIQKYSGKIAGVVLSGSAFMASGLVKIGKSIANLQSAILDNYKPAKLIAKLSFGSFSNPFKDSDLENRWLSRDQELVKKYNADKYCGYVMSIGFQSSFMSAIVKLYSKELLNSIPKDLPIMIASGALDPVGGAGKLVNKLYNVYKEAGLENVTLKLYPEARHEIINEINKEEVYNDISTFYDNIL